MNSATSASLSNTSSQQLYGSGATSDASAPASPYLSSPSLTSQDSFGKEGADQQAPKKKHTLAKVLGGITAFLAVVGLGCLTRSGIRSSHINEQIEAFKDRSETNMKKMLNDHFKVENGSVKSTYEETQGMSDTDKIKHPNAYAHMLEKALHMDEAGQTKYITDLKIDGDHKAVLKNWLKDNEIAK